jgi:hypothetical protein
MPSRAGLAEPRPTSDLACRGRRGWAEGHWQRLGEPGQGRALGEGRDLGGVGRCFWGKFLALGKACPSKACLEAGGPFLVVFPEKVLAFLGV